MYETVIFDFDGTIYDTLEGICNCMQYALKKQGIDEDKENLRCFAGPPLEQKLKEVYGFSDEKASETVKAFRERYVPVGVYESRIFEGIPELLSELKKHGIRLGIATSKPLAMAEKLLKLQNIYDYFDVVSGSIPETGKCSKEYVLNQALDKLGADREKTVLVGDTKYDVEGAEKCGLKCIGAGYGYAAPGELENAGALIIADDIPRLLKILLS